jgi:hypothetical protein
LVGNQSALRRQGGIQFAQRLKALAQRRLEFGAFLAQRLDVDGLAGLAQFLKAHHQI